MFSLVYIPDPSISAQLQTETLSTIFSMQLKSTIMLLQALTTTQILAVAIPIQGNGSTGI